MQTMFIFVFVKCCVCVYVLYTDVTSNAKTGIRLWHFLNEAPIASFITPVKKLHDLGTTMSSGSATGIGSSGATKQAKVKNIKNERMAAIRFNEYGNKLAALSSSGSLYLWHFNVPRSIYRRDFRIFHVSFFFFIFFSLISVCLTLFILFLFCYFI